VPTEKVNSGRRWGPKKRDREDPDKRGKPTHAKFGLICGKGNYRRERGKGKFVRGKNGGCGGWWLGWELWPRLAQRRKRKRKELGGKGEVD